MDTEIYNITSLSYYKLSQIKRYIVKRQFLFLTTTRLGVYRIAGRKLHQISFEAIILAMLDLFYFARAQIHKIYSK